MIPTPLYLYAPKSFWSSTDENRRIICSGCGTKGLTGLFVPDTMYLLNISPACNIHDWMYHEGTTLADKERADRIFLNNLIRLITIESKSRLLISLRKRRAFKYYKAVDIFGAPAYWSSKEDSPQSQQEFTVRSVPEILSDIKNI